MSRRRLLLGLALLVSVAWSAWTITAPADDVVQATVRPNVRVDAPTPSLAPGRAAAPATPQALLSDRLELPQRPRAPDKSRNLFAAYSYEAPRPRTVAVAPEPPRAPPLPFVFTGRLIVEGRATYLLLEGTAPISATLGSDIGDFRLVEAAPERLVFLHGPTGQRVALSIGAAVN